MSQSRIGFTLGDFAHRLLLRELWRLGGVEGMSAGTVLVVKGAFFMQLRQQATILAAATILLSSASAWAQERSAASPLEGRWKVISADSNGGDYMLDVRDKMIVRIEKDTIRFLIDGTDSEQAAKIVLRPDRKPAEIDTREIKDHKWNNGNGVTKLFRA